MTESQNVTVGIDTSQASRPAAVWAAGEALRRGGVLRLVNAYGVESPMEIADAAPGEARRSSEQLIQEVDEEVRARHPELATEPRSVVEGSVEALLAEATPRRLVVLGSRGLGTVAGYFMGSVSQHVVARADGTVVVIRSGWDPDQDQGREVVLGLKSPGDRDDRVIQEAFSAARLRDMPLRVVHNWKPPVVLGPFPPVVAIMAEQEPAAAQGLREALAPWQARYPDVEVRQEAVAGTAAVGTLLDAATHAALLVVGRGGRRLGGLGPRTGPVAHGLLHHAHCPVAIVPTG